MILNWHLVRCASGHTLSRITSDIASVTDLATCLYREEMIVRHGRILARRYPIFQTPYIFARWQTNDAAVWHKVRWIRGVLEIIGGEVPAIISDEEVESWLALADEAGVIHDTVLAKSLFQIGDLVQFSRGAFCDQVGEFVGFRGQAVGVKIPFLGGDTVIYLPSNIVRCAERAPDFVSRTRRCRRSKRGGIRRYDAEKGYFSVTGGAPLFVSASV